MFLYLHSFTSLQFVSVYHTEPYIAPPPPNVEYERLAQWDWEWYSTTVQEREKRILLHSNLILYQN